MTPKKKDQMAAPAGDAKPRRKNKPEYVVFRLMRLSTAPPSGEGVGAASVQAWVPVLGNEKGEPQVVQAASRKEAIVKATSGTDDPEQKQGSFLVVPVQEWQIIKRKTRTEVVDDFE